MLVKYKGTNNSLQAYGYRFEKDKLVNVEDSEVLEKLKERDDFELVEPKKEKTTTRRKSEGVTDADTKESKRAE